MGLNQYNSLREKQVLTSQKEYYWIMSQISHSQEEESLAESWEFGKPCLIPPFSVWALPHTLVCCQPWLLTADRLISLVMLLHPHLDHWAASHFPKAQPWDSRVIIFGSNCSLLDFNTSTLSLLIKAQLASCGSFESDSSLSFITESS